MVESNPTSGPSIPAEQSNGTTAAGGIRPENVVGATVDAPKRAKKIVKKVRCFVCGLIPNTIVQCQLCKKAVCLNDYYKESAKRKCKCDPKGTFDTPNIDHIKLRGIVSH